MNSFMINVLRERGEGIILREGESFYQTGRAENILKLKPFRDEIALIVEVEDGSYRCLLYDFISCSYPFLLSMFLQRKWDGVPNIPR